MRTPARAHALTVSYSVLGALVALALLGPWVGPPGFAESSAVFRWLEGTRRTVFSATLAVAVCAAASAVLSGMAAAGPRIFDSALSRAAEVVSALPSVVVVLLLGAATSHRGATTIGVALGVIRGVGTARVLRTAGLQIAREEYVLSARALGSGPARLFWTHLFRPLFGVWLSQAAFTAAALVGLEAAIAFLGGDTGGATLGGLVAEAVRNHAFGPAFPPVAATAALLTALQIVGLHFSERAAVGRRFL